MKKTDPEKTKNLVETQSREIANYNSIAIFLSVISPAYVVFIVFDYHKNFWEGFGFKSAIAAGFVVYSFVVGLLLLYFEKISPLGFALMVSISLGVMCIFITSQLNLWIKMLVVAGFLILSFPLVNLFKWLAHKIINIKINKKGYES